MKRVNGRITSWDDDKGYGFISSMDGASRTFVHIKAFKNRIRRPVTGDLVTYSVSKDTNNRPCAAKVSLVRVKENGKSHRRSYAMPDFIGFLFLVTLASAAWWEAIPRSLATVYFVLSVLTFILYAKDKSAAQKDDWRISENTLHLFALVGGWPGALVAQNRLRHKSRKQPFRTIFWVTVTMNCGALAWLLTPEGEQKWLIWVNGALSNMPFL
ncbi:MAG: cold shock and DUF1294 domain-containing protein [Methylophaga sp.]